jgi:hypothetical protein
MLIEDIINTVLRMCRYYRGCGRFINNPGCWKAKVEAAVKDRINICLQADYAGVGRHMAMAPVGWA